MTSLSDNLMQGEHPHPQSPRGEGRPRKILLNDKDIQNSTDEVNHDNEAVVDTLNINESDVDTSAQISNDTALIAPKPLMTDGAMLRVQLMER